MANLTELKLDLEEFETLLKSSNRLKVQGCLTYEIGRLKLEISKLEAKATAAVDGTGGKEVKKGYQENITKYAWDQSDKFMKLYLSLDSLSSITEADISSQFDNRAVMVKVQFPHKCSTLHIARLSEEICPKESYIKKKSDYVLVMMKKADVGKTWTWVTEREKKAKEIKENNKPKFDDKEDPGASLTNLLKNMYDDGDDEMKRTISKAFYESQMKQKEGKDPMDL